MRERDIKFSGKLRPDGAAYSGWVSIDYSDAPSDDSGLWVTAYAGWNSPIAEPNRSPGWQILRPDSELLMTAAACALGVMPPWAFADWLEDRADAILPQLRRFEGHTPEQMREHWDGVLFHLRRFAAQPSSP